MSSGNFKLTPQAVPKIRTRFRRIATKIPAPGSLKILKQLDRYESRSMHGQLPVVWDKAVDFQVFDGHGNKWIDFTSTIFVANSGHSNPKVLRSLKEQISKKLIHSYTFANEIRVKFLKKLIDCTPEFCEKAFLLSAGTEATECAVKLMRMYGNECSPKKNVIISFKGGMHGRTMAAEMLKDDPDGSSWIGYKDPNMYSLPFPYPWLADSTSFDWKKKFNDDINKLKAGGVDFKNICGFMIESYLGWGAIFYPKEYLKALADFARQHDALITFDEIQGGFGRTGKLFVFQHYGIEPDLVCLGKALSNGLPLSALAGRRKIMDIPEIGSMSSTHSANPLCCAAGLANIEAIISGQLIDKSAKNGKLLHERLNMIKNKFSRRISYIFGKGLLAAVLFREPRTGRPDKNFPTKVCERAMQKGLLLVHTGREAIKIGPPLTIKKEALKEGLNVLEEAIAEVDAKEKN